MAAQQPCPHLAWFNVADPNSPELDELARRYHLHELQIEDCRHRPQRAKAEEHDSYLFCVLKELCPGQAISFRDLDVFYGKDYVVTVHEGSSAALGKVRERAMQDKVQRLDRLFYIVVDAVVDEYQGRLDDLSDATSEIESEVLQRPDPPMLRRIFELKRNLIEFRRISGAMREVANAIMRREGGLVGDDLDPYFRDVYDHLVRTVDLIETYRDLLTGALDIYLSAVANRTNEVMKILTIWGTVALPLVIITGFFGMNLHLPWMNNPHGAVYSLLMMGVSTLLILLYFKRKGWF